MNISRYRFTILFVCITLTGVSFFTVFRWDIAEMYSKKIGSMGFVHDMIVLGHTDTTPPIPIDIRSLTSPRYLYTLTQELQKKSLSGFILPIEANYTSFPDVKVDNEEFIFTFTGSTLIRLPTSSFFFDLSGKNTSVSGEANISTGTIAKQKVIALTFDDGPSGKYTNTLLDILKSHKVRATFFVLGARALEHPEILRREKSEWHEIGNHSFSHTDFTRISTGAIQDEIYRTDQAIYAAIGHYPVLFRPPYWAINTGMLMDISMPFAMWDIDTQDWRTKNIKKNIASISNVKSGDIIIMHDIHETSVASVAAIVESLKSRGFSFLTVSEILELSRSNQQIGKKCYKRGDCR